MKRYHAFWSVLALLLAVGALGLRADDQPANVAGTWNMTVNSDQGALTMVLTIQQDGGKIKGTSKSDFGESQLDGTVKGNSIDFIVHVKSDNGDFDVRAHRDGRWRHDKGHIQDARQRRLLRAVVGHAAEAVKKSRDCVNASRG